MTQDPDGAEAGAEPTTPPGGGTPEPGLSSIREVPYKGEELDAERGPGLGCFRFQIVVLAFFIILTPIGVTLGWPDWLTGGMLLIVIVLLFFTGQTMIFLMRLVAADRRGRRRPLAGATPTVGQIEDAEEASSAGTAAPSAETASPAPAGDTAEAAGTAQDDEPTVRQ